MSDPRGVLLIASQDPSLREPLAGLVDRGGYRATFAACGRDVLEFLQRSEPDLLLLDAQLDDPTGLDLCRALKARHQTEHVPILVLTDGAGQGEVLDVLAAGADDFAARGGLLAELGPRIDHLVRRKQAHDLLRAHNDELMETLADQSRSIAEIFSLSMQMNLSRDLRSLVGVLASSCRGLVACGAVGVYLFEPRSQVLRLADGTTVSAGLPRTLTLSGPDSHWLFEQRLPFPVGPESSPPPSLRPLLRSEETRGLLLPLAVDRRRLGLVWLAAPAQSILTPHDVAVLTFFSQAAGVAIENRLREIQIRETQDVTIFAMAKLAENRDELTGNHLARVQTYARELALHLARRPRYKGVLTEGMIEEIHRAAPLHDIGKVGIPDAILLKPGRLTADERSMMQQHTVIGGRTLQAASARLRQDSFLRTAQEICFSHHEHWDGSGYPAGLVGEEIPLSARIVACADVYDALTTARPYKPAFGHERSRAIVAEGRGTHFDPDVCDAFLELERKFDSIRRELADVPGTGSLLQASYAATETSEPWAQI